MSDRQAKNQADSRWQLTVVGEGSAVLELFTGEDQSLLVRGDTLLVLDLRLDVVDGVGRLDLKGDGLSGEPVRQRLRNRAYLPPIARAHTS